MLRPSNEKKEEEQSRGEIETHHPGYLGAQDTYNVEYIKVLARFISKQLSIHISRVTFAKVYDRKNALVAADMLNDKMLPFYLEQEIDLLRILTDRGTEYFGAKEQHEYQLYLNIEDIDHTKTKAKSPQTYGICAVVELNGSIGPCRRSFMPLLSETIFIIAWIKCRMTSTSGSSTTIQIVPTAEGIATAKHLCRRF